MKNKTLATLVATIITILFIGTFTVLSANDTFKKCAGCHGVNGEKKALGKSKVIADMNSTEIVIALTGYKDETYGGTMKGLMKGQVKDLSQTQITDLSTYISNFKK